MNHWKKKQMQRIIEQVSAKEGVSGEHARQTIRVAIDAAYHSADLVTRSNFLTLFGPEKPSVEEFISKAAFFICIDAH